MGRFRDAFGGAEHAGTGENMSRADAVYKPALAGKKLPPLTLDNKWHKLFTQTKKPDKRLIALEEELNGLLKEQGKKGTEIRKIRKLKRKLMQDIMDNAGEASTGNKAAIKKTDESKRLLEDCNVKLAEYEDDVYGLPARIDKVNKELMLITMELCYDQLKKNQQEIAEITEWVAQTRIELRERLVRKEEMEETNHELYSYMHDIFGAKVIDMFDMKYYRDDEDEEGK